MNLAAIKTGSMSLSKNTESNEQTVQVSYKVGTTVRYEIKEWLIGQLLMYLKYFYITNISKFAIFRNRRYFYL